MEIGESGDREAVSRVLCSIGVSLDGFVAGPRPSLEKPLGEGGDFEAVVHLRFSIPRD